MGSPRQVLVRLDSLPSNYCRFESTAVIGVLLIVSRFRGIVITSVTVIITVIIVCDSVYKAGGAFILLSFDQTHATYNFPHGLTCFRRGKLHLAAFASHNFVYLLKLSCRQKLDKKMTVLLIQLIICIVYNITIL